jgi:hypothetical protein
MKVELKVFSGRPNPRWFLAPDKAPAFEAILMRLPHHGTAFPPLHVMGYRGIALTNEDPSGQWTDILVYHEQITVRAKNRTDYLIDDEQAVENLLLETARGHVGDALAERIRAERQPARGNSTAGGPRGCDAREPAGVVVGRNKELPPADQHTQDSVMDNPTYDEAIYMVRVKRRRAKEAISRIIERNGEISYEPAPGLEVLIDYFVNMVYGLEMLLKVLAQDWDTPGKSTYRHKVGEMYKVVFGRPHADPAFMKELEDAILDQKFLYGPAKGLLDRVEAIEALWDELKLEYCQRSWKRIAQVKKEVTTDAAFGQYLMRNVARFITTRGHQSNPMTTEEKVAMHRVQIQLLQREIERLEQEGEPEETLPDLMDRLQREHEERVANLSHMMGLNFQMRGSSALRFSTWSVGVAWDDLG